MTDTFPPEPLTPAVFHILVALATGEKHGYQIMKQVTQDTNGSVRMGNGTLYGSIKRMLADGLIADSDSPDEGEERRKYYKLTAAGRRALQAEAKRYVETAEMLKGGWLPPKFLPGGAR